ncbi:MAG: DUF3575 domain-containing protein [Rikenellaceae bacterium]
MRRIVLFLALSLILGAVSIDGAKAQRVAVKTNLVGLSTLSANAALDMAVSRRWSLEFGASYNSWGGSDKLQELDEKVDWMQKRHVTFDANAKYWFARPFNGHALLAGIKLGTYNYDLFGMRFYGDAATVGGGYSYTYVISPRLNIEGAISAGFGLASEITENGVAPTPKFMPMIHKVGLSIVYVIK